MHSNSIVPNESLTKSGESVLLKLEPSRSSHSKALNFTFDDKTVFPEPSRLGENSDYQVPSKSILKRKSSSFQYNVSFNCVDVREYDRTVGDNPSCRSGPPLSLDWAYSAVVRKNIDDYELERSSERAKHLSQLLVNKYTRRNMLTFIWGHTEEEMERASRHTKHIRRQRSITKVFMPVYFAIEMCINARNSASGKNQEGMNDSSSRTSIDTDYVMKMRHIRSETQETFDLSSYCVEFDSA